MTDCRFTRSTSVAETISAIQAADGDATVIAGGIALGILMNEKLLAPSHLIDISRLEGFGGVDCLEDGSLRIGALCTHHEVETSAIVKQSMPVLSEVAAEIACGRIKNRGTIGGNVCLADAQADMPVAALALSARMTTVGAGGERTIAADQFFVGLMETALAEDELLMELVFPSLPPHSGVAYGKFGARKAMDYSSTITVVARVTVDPGDGMIADATLGFGGMGFIPLRPRQTEAALIGRPLGAETFDAARQAIARECEPLEDDLYSAEFKLHVASVILKRTLAEAYARALPGRES